MPAEIVYEDDNSVAFLDIAPRSTGMTIVASKQHYSFFDENIELSTKIFQSAQIVAQMIKQALNPLAIDFSVIPSQEVPHFHIRVYPVYEKEVPLVENQPKQVTGQELKEVAERIRSKNEVKQEKIEEPKVEEKEEPKRSKEEIEWIKRQLEIA
jgi:histidine triad (HIT) family protein